MDSQKVIYKNAEKSPFISQQTYLYTRVTNILKFYAVLFCTYCKGLFCLYKTVMMLIFLCICKKHFQHQEITKNNSKLNFKKNRWASWFSRRWLKISKCSISLAWLRECSKSKVTPLHVYLDMLPKLWQTFCCYRQKIQKVHSFWHFKDHKCESKHDN